MKHFTTILIITLLTLPFLNAQEPGFHIEPDHNVLFGDSMTDSGTKFMWIPSKGALRAGKVDGTSWNLDSIGDYSVAFGDNNQVKGATSLSWGRNNKTDGQRSATWGFGNTTDGNYSATWGVNNKTHSYGSTS